MKRKILAVILALCMVFPLLPLTGVLSFAENGIMYYDENGNVQYYTGTLSEITPSNWGTEGQTTWYYVNETFNPYNRLSFRGDVRLILGNDALITFDNMNEPHPVETASYNGRHLTIYAQSKNKNECGKMILNCFGSEGYRGLGTITINGGNIVSTAIDFYTYWERGKDYMCDMAGLGLYLTYESTPRYGGGSITINGGYVKATGSRFSAGIGGSFGSSVQTITINGGEVEAYGGYGAPGIGTGYGCNTKNEECVININGGTVTAVGGDGAPGIGSGYKAQNNLTVNITGGVINATAGTNSMTNLPEFQKQYKITEEYGGAGIGCGARTSGTVTVNIDGGDVTATATQGAAIGGSMENIGNVNVNISGGTVNATSQRGAGIGSGYAQNLNNQISGKATRVNISGGTVTASSTNAGQNGAGIGSGDTSKCPVYVNISDGNVTANSDNAKGIGDGNNTAKTNVTLSWTRVTSSIYASSYNDNTVFASPFRDSSITVTALPVASPGDAAETTIRPLVYCYDNGSDDSVYLEMTGCEKKYLDEYVNSVFLPFLEDRVIYVVDKDLTLDHSLGVCGTTVLFLCENATLTVNGSIYVYNDDSPDKGLGEQHGNLIIVAEKQDSGKLIVNGMENCAAIGSDVDTVDGRFYGTGLIRVYSGTVEAHGTAGCPAIGGKNLHFSMLDGVVKAYGGEGAAAIGSFPGDTSTLTIDVLGGQLTAVGGTTAEPVGLGNSNATINVSWKHDTDAYNLDPCFGTVNIEAGKEFKYLNSSPIQTAVASDFATGGVFVPHTSAYYVDVNGDVQRVNDFTELSNNGNASSSMSTVDGGWYVCVNDARNPLQILTITVNGTMNLILTDGTEMRPNSIIVPPGATLNVYGQYAGTGVLRVYGSQSDSGIGGSSANFNCGTVNIYGGKIIAQASEYAAGIGGAGLSGNGGTISIYGGDVEVTPHDDYDHSKLLGIGDGWNQSGAVINYYGGRIDPGAVNGTVNFHNYFLYEDDGSRVYEDEYDPSRVIVPGLPEAAEYIDENGNAQSTYAYKRLHTDTATLSGVYYVYEDITLPARPTVSGTATLILKDGVTLTAEKGIGVNAGNTLKIYAHSTDENVMGALTIGTPDAICSGIGGDGYLLTGTSGQNYDDYLGSGSIVIAGGKVTAVGGAGGAGIGSGYGRTNNPKTGGSVTITGGYIYATGGNGSPAIGSAGASNSVTIDISGGTVNATGTGAPAIGAVDNGSCVIDISGGVINATNTGFQTYTIIGSRFAGTVITISGGQIDASRAGNNGSGIGYTTNDSVTIKANNSDMSVKYYKVQAQVITLVGDFAYPDGTLATNSLADNRTIKPLASNFSKVTFDPDNGGAENFVYVPNGGKVSAPANPEAPEGYHFIGWYDDDNGSGSAFNFDEEFIYADITLKAHYEKNVYTVTFDPDNGGETFTQSVEHGENATEPTAPEKDHATFDGWFAEGASTPFDFANTPITAPLTLTAHWTFDNVTVTFDTMDGNTTTQSVVYGGHATRPADPTRAGYVFSGWRIAQDISNFNFEAATLTNDLTLYAVWTYQPYTAITGTMGANWQGTEDYDKLLDNNTSTKWCVTSFTGCFVEFKASDYIVPTGYIFTTGNDTADDPGRNPKGWKIYGKYDKSESWTEITSVTDNTKMTNVNYTPFIFDMNNAKTYRYFKLEITSIQGGRLGVFQLSEFAFIVDSITAIPNVTVSFDYGAGSGSVGSLAVPKDDDITLPVESDVSVPDGKIFTGWTDGSTTYQPGASYTASANVTFTAVYEDTVTVTFVSGSQTSRAYSFPSGKVIDIPGNEQEFGLTPPAGKIFDCWELDGTNYYMGETYTVTSTVVFTAVWRDASAWELLQAQFDELSDGDSLTVTLTEDLAAPTGADCLYIKDGTDVTIDLAGHTIDRALTNKTSDGMVFYVEGNLTICDSSSNGTGVITGGFNDGDGGGFFVRYTGSLTITGGTVTGNKSDYGGGVEANGAFIMTGGTITGNYAFYYGGGVEIYDDYCSLTLSGSAKIYGNVIARYDDDEGTFVTVRDDDISLYDGQVLTIGGAFTSGARIGVSFDQTIDEDEPYTFTTGLNGASVSPFFADDSALTITVDGYGEACAAVFTWLLGDIDGDGEVGATDLTVLARHVAKIELITDATLLLAADVNKDGTIDSSDLTHLARYVAKIINTL